jgi:transposase
LKKIVKSRSLPAKIVMRARSILLTGKGLSARKIAGLIDCVPSTVSNWAARWINDPPQNKRLLKEWFEDRPRSGTPCKFSINQRTQIIALACEKPKVHGLPIATWTSEEIRQTAIKKNLVEAISRRHVSRILLDVDLKPHRSRYWLNSKPDPQKAPKIKAINKAYKQASKLEKKGILTFSLDEMTGIQALERIAEDKPSKPGMTRCIEYEYKRHGTYVCWEPITLLKERSLVWSCLKERKRILSPS